MTTEYLMLLALLTAIMAVGSGDLLGGWPLSHSHKISISIVSRFARGCEIIGLKFQKALLECRKRILELRMFITKCCIRHVESRIRFREAQKLNLIRRHWFAIVADVLCSLYVHIFCGANPPNS